MKKKDTGNFYGQLVTALGFTPGEQQRRALKELSDFLGDVTRGGIFVLQGYAGTGKTSIIAALVSMFDVPVRVPVLMAPTGRAAKVMSLYSGQKAFTIHKYIYAPLNTADGSVHFALKENKSSNRIYIVDEASMVGDRAGESLAFSNSSLLDDLIAFVQAGNNCKLILVGDNAQLPPVGYEYSPALDKSYLTRKYIPEVYKTDLTEVFRQKEGSSVLENATLIRQAIENNDLGWGSLKFRCDGDFVRLSDGYQVQDAIYSAYSQAGEDETIIITRSNKRANLFNGQIRGRIKLQEGELSTGDILMVVRNNYFWMEERKSQCGFIANGDIIEVQKVIRFEELYGLRFARVEVRLLDYPLDGNFETVLLLDTLSTETPSMPSQRMSAFFNEVMKDYPEDPYPLALYKVRKNPYFNALQVKFAYAVTCHKSQGGQWERVFVEQVYMPEKQMSVDYLRWLYTAVTRAKSKVYLLGFEDDFFET